MREESPIKESYQPAPTGGDLPAFYFTLKRKKPEQFENLQLNLRMLIPAIQGVDAVLTDEGKVRLVVQERGVEFSAKVISEGTLRVLALLAIFSPQNPSTVIGIEEPENGVHPRRLKLIANLLDLASRHRQVLINTHSNLLPDYLRGAYLVRCRKENGHSTFAPLEEAEGIFRAPQVDRALEDEEKRVSLAQQILRGDWG
jgi:predicted ATPase